MTSALHPVLAHQGGWDEFLYFGVPVILAIVGVRWAEKRAKANRERTERTTDDPTDP